MGELFACLKYKTLKIMTSPGESEEKKPIELDWCCGANTVIPHLDLTTKEKPHTIAFAANHLVIIQDIENDKHFPLIGHRNNLTCLTVSKCKRWTVSGDHGNGSSVIIWDNATYEGIQILDQVSFPELGSGIAAVSFLKDAKTLVVLSAESILSFWRWSLDKPFLFGVIELDQPVSLLNPPFIISTQIEEKNHQLVITFPQSTVFLQVQETNEEVNIDGEIITRECIRHAKETLVPDEDEIGTLREGWMFGSSNFISKTKIVTHFTQGFGALLISEKVENSIRWRHKKMIKFCEKPLTSVDIFTGKDTFPVIAISDATGHVRFLSPELKILFWLKRPILNGLTNIKFTEKKLESLGLEAEGEESTVEKGEFVAPPFSAMTSSGCIFGVDEGRPHLVFEGAPDGDIRLIAHPTRDLIVVAGTHEIRLMSVDNRGRCLVRTTYESEEICALTFSASGGELSIGCASGKNYQLDTLSLCELSKLKLSTHSIQDIIYSQSGLYFAAADASFAVTLWERDQITSNNWKEMGRFRPHSRKIVQLLFINEYGVERLLSMGEDRKLVEYVIEDKLRIHSQYKIEADVLPTCLIQYPAQRDEEEFLLTSNNQFKLRLFNQSTKLPRRITNTQKYDSPITKLISRPNNLPVLAFTTKTCFGVMLLPIDGNPNREYAILANPGGITGAAAGTNSVVTSGPGVILSWKINEPALDKHRMRGGLGMAPFYNLLEENEFKLLQNVFYFCQLEAQGLDTETERRVSRSIPLRKVADAVRALGWFPSELQIEELHQEIKFSQFHKTQEQVTEVDLDDFIKLYLNHRPVDQLSHEEVEAAFKVLGNGSMNPGELMHTLENYGEKMSSKEFAECIEKLCGGRAFSDLLHISPQDFTERILRI